MYQLKVDAIVAQSVTRPMLICTGHTTATVRYAKKHQVRQRKLVFSLNQEP